MAVLVGVAFEGPELVYDIWNLWGPKRREDKQWIKVLGMIGWILVVGGVAGECAFEGYVSTTDSQIQTFDEILLGNTQRQAGAANERAAMLEKEAAKLNEEAQGERLAEASLEVEIQPRRLSSEEIREIGDSLKPYAGKIVGVGTYHQDVEAMVLGIQIEDALKKAHITVWDRLGTFGAVGRPIYMGVLVDPTSPDRELTSALIKALSTKGQLAVTSESVVFGPGSSMYLPASPPHPPGPSFVQAGFIFVGVKPFGNPTQKK